MKFGRWTSGEGAGEEWDATTRLDPADEEPKAEPRPSTVEKLYVETEYKAIADAQPDAFEARGITEAMPAGKQATGLGHDAGEAIGASSRASDEATDLVGLRKRARNVLGPHRRRAKGTTRIKYLITILQFGGEGGAVYGAIILFGEQPIYALLQGISVAATAVVLGFVGRELKHWQAARTRQPASELTEEQEMFYSFFNGYQGAVQIVVLVALACLLGTLSVAFGISELRNGTQGREAATAWFCFAIALGIGSFANYYHAADEVADFLDNLDQQRDEAEQWVKQARQEPVIRQRAEATTEHDEIKRRSILEGKAAAKNVLAKLWNMLAANPLVAGHGTAPTKAPPESSESNGHGNPDQLDMEEILR
jgi:hypothetical protein